MESGGERGGDVGEVRNKETLITGRHNMITAVVKIHKPHTYSLSARRRPR